MRCSMNRYVVECVLYRNRWRMQRIHTRFLTTTYAGSDEHVDSVFGPCNNLYGAAMMTPLPYGEYEWMPDWEMRVLFNGRTTMNDSKEFTHVSEDFRRTSFLAWLDKQVEDQDKGFVLEVDIEYPDEIHDLMNDYPVAVERKEVWYTTQRETARAVRGKLLCG